MDLQKKIQERRLERELEEKERQAQEKKLQSDQQKIALQKAKELLKSKSNSLNMNSNQQPVTTEGIEDQRDTDEKIGADLEDLDAATKEIAQRDAKKLIDDEAVERVDGVSKCVVFALLGIGLYQLFASGWIGSFWIVAGLAFFAFRVNQERKNLLDEMD